jgi:uncharacterized lipoprotein YddW (UPF0748 family)
MEKVIPPLKKLVVAFLAATCLQLISQASHADPPEVRREFRAAWIATVYNLDWPSRPGLSASQQQTELIRIFDRAVELNLNAIIFQVRPQSDAVYRSRYEPWAPYLTGEMGEDPGYDPLQFAVEQAHKRGLELHAWFNPFRGVTNYKNPVSSSHITKREPEFARRYGNYIWMDPGEPSVRAHVKRVVMDVVRRYDIDGVHFDDYFYPYKVAGKDFPDNSTYRRYGNGMNRGDWRRNNVNQFVRDLYSSIKSEKGWVKFGISPFGIWRPGVPSTIEAGVDSYGDLYADSRLWFQKGWVDYIAPQLYWNIAPAKQSFPVLLRWWAQQNERGRHLWAGIATERVGKKRTASEIANQINITRDLHGADGQIHWSMKALMSNQGGVTRLLEGGVYEDVALIPPSPWLDSQPPGRPDAERDREPSGIGYSWQPASESDGVARWLVQARFGNSWRNEILPVEARNRVYSGASRQPDEFAVTAIDRCGNVSAPAKILR